MKHVAGFPNSSGTWITSTALARLQAARSGATTIEHTSTKAVSIRPPSNRARLARIHPSGAMAAENTGRHFREMGLGAALVSRSRGWPAAWPLSLLIADARTL